MEHAHHRLEDVAAVGIVVVEQLGDDLGVRLGAESVALVQQLLLELDVVFNDAVVDNGDFAALADVGVGVDIVRLAVGGPAGVADADRARQIRALVRQVAEHLQPPARLLHAERTRAADGDARRVIAAVFQTPQTVQQNGSRLLLAHISNNSTHMKSSS